MPVAASIGDTIQASGSHVIQEEDNIKRQSNQYLRRGLHVVLYTTASVFDVTILAFRKVLVLVMRLALEVVDGI
jgi:hypothetical protein